MKRSFIISKHYQLFSVIRMLLPAVILFSSCSKEDFNPDMTETDWQPEIAFPLAYSEAGIADMAHVNDTNTTIIVGTDNFCTLVYQDRIFDLSSDQLLQVPGQSYQNRMYLNSNQAQILSGSGQLQVVENQQISINIPQGVQIDSMILKNSKLNLDITSTISSNTDVRITIPGLVKNNVAFTTVIHLNNNTNNPLNQFVDFDLDNYHIDLTHNGTASNTLEVIYTIDFNGNGQGNTTSSYLDFHISLDPLAYRIMYGYAGQQNIGSIPDSLFISIFKNSAGFGNFNIADPKIRFDIGNSLGIPFDARISQLTAWGNNQSGFTVATGIPDPLPVSSPSINQIGQTLSNSFTLDNTNSNVNNIIASQPSFLTIQSQLMMNPGGNQNNFITDSSHLSMDVRVELPLYGTASDFRIQDTVPFNYNDLDKVENLTLRINVENWFPLEAGIQLIFMDDSYLPLDTIFSSNEVVVPSGAIRGLDERVSVAGRKIHDHIFSRERIEKILSAKHILVQASATSLQGGTTNVKIYSDYKLKVKIGAIVKLKL